MSIQFDWDHGNRTKYRKHGLTQAYAKAFLTQDPSNLDYATFHRLSWEAEPKTARLNMRLPQGLIDAIKARAKERGIPDQRLIREAPERMTRQT